MAIDSVEPEYIGAPLHQRKDLFPEREYSFETPPPPIPESEIGRRFSTEVLVVGAGFAGLSAALSAKEQGAQVILIEKTGSFQARGHDIAFIGSRIQKQLGVEIDPNEVVLNLMKYCANKPDQRVLRMWAQDSRQTADWLMEMTDSSGITFYLHQDPVSTRAEQPPEYYPTYPVTHLNNKDSVRPVARCLMDNALKKGVEISFNIRATQLIRAGKARVAGVIARNTSGEFIRYTASKAVILCTGDYGYNAEMMAKYCPQSAYLPSVLPTSTGDGHLMAMWAGAVMEPAPHAPISHGRPGPLYSAAFLEVHIKGERFQNEDVSSQSYTNAVERQAGHTSWQVFDSKYREEVPRLGPFRKGKSISVTEDLRRQVEQESVTADTLEGLAQKMEVPVETFKATIGRYNELARIGKDLDFGKRADRLTTVDRPPFYAGKGRYRFLCVMGGLNLNPKLQALDKDWEVIPGLYLAGNTMGNRFAVDYPMMCPGLSHGMAIHYGRVAGSNAARLEA